MKVENMTTRRGNVIPNQFVIKTDRGTIYQSYDSTIVFIPKEGKTQLGKNWAYSNTTGKYRNQFLGETKKETEQKLKDGIYELNLDL